MAREDFIDNLRLASRELALPSVRTDQGSASANGLAVLLRADLWLTTKAVEGFDPADFADWPAVERAALGQAVAAFRAIARQVSPDKPASRAQSQQARKHLQQIVALVGQRLLDEWLAALRHLMAEAATAATAEGWHAELDEKDLRESLLGLYRAPRLRVRTPRHEVVLDPLARFGSGRQGIVDLVALPTYETKYLVTWRDGDWRIVSPERSLHTRPCTQKTLVNTIARLATR